jgi:hypothetical protein
MIKILEKMWLPVLCLLHGFNIYNIYSRVSWSMVSAWTVLAGFMGFFIISSVVSFIHWFLDTWTTGNTSMRKRLFNQAKTHHYHPQLVVDKGVFARNDDAIYGSAIMCVVLPLLDLTPNGLVLGYSMALSGLFSLEIHRYAHLNVADVPTPIRLLQRSGLLLSKESHLRHHGTKVHNCSYNLMCGWMNVLEDATGIYPALERLVTWATGLQPRTYLADKEQKDELDAYYMGHKSEAT